MTPIAAKAPTLPENAKQQHMSVPLPAPQKAQMAQAKSPSSYVIVMGVPDAAREESPEEGIMTTKEVLSCRTRRRRA